ncbi:MAG: ferrous iron transport protein A [bacterium]|nr:ferrous iron transport protein A [bacterium]
MRSSQPVAPSPAIPLAAARRNQAVEIRFFAFADHVAKPLRDVGLREGAALRIVSSHRRVIVAIGTSRIAVAADLAAGVFVEELAR